MLLSSLLGLVLFVGQVVAPVPPGVTSVTQTPPPDEPFVQRAYRAVLERPPTPTELAQAMQSLGAGTTRSALVAGLLASDAFTQRTVDFLYRHYLHRPPDPSGAANALALERGGTTLAALIASLLGSAEYSGLHPGNGEWIDALYGDLLNRPPTLTERTSLLTTLGSGATRAALAQQLTEGDVAQPYILGQLYNGVLHRPGTLPAPTLVDSLMYDIESRLGASPAPAGVAPPTAAPTRRPPRSR